MKRTASSQRSVEGHSDDGTHVDALRENAVDLENGDECVVGLPLRLAELH